MNRYSVRWTLQVDAASAEDAAQHALDEVRDAAPGSPTVFEVAELRPGARSRVTLVDVDYVKAERGPSVVSARRRCSCCPRVYPRCVRRAS